MPKACSDTCYAKRDRALGPLLVLHLSFTLNNDDDNDEDDDDR